MPRRSLSHHFASLCANHPVAYRKALAWLGHGSSGMPDLYYHLHVEDSPQAMMALASGDGEDDSEGESGGLFGGQFEGNRGVNNRESPPRVPETKELMERPQNMAERGRFELPVSRSPRRFSKPVHSTALAPLRTVSDAGSYHFASAAVHPFAAHARDYAAFLRAGCSQGSAVAEDLPRNRNPPLDA